MQRKFITLDRKKTVTRKYYKENTWKNKNIASMEKLSYKEMKELSSKTLTFPPRFGL